MAWAQSMAGAEYRAPAGKEAAKQAERRPPGVALRSRPPLAALPPVSHEEIARIEPRAGRDPIGIHRPVAEAMAGLGGSAWTRDADGGGLWRLELRSPGAAAMRVRLEQFDVGAGEVWIHDGGERVIGPYTGRGPDGAAGAFWSDLLPGDSVVLELAPADGRDQGEPSFRIAAVSHLGDALAAG